MAVYDTQGRPVVVDIATVYSSSYSAGVQGVGVSTMGNTAGNTGTGTGTLYLAGSNNVTLNQSTVLGASTVWISAAGAGAEANWHTLAGNVAGNSSASGSTIALYGGANITLHGTNDSQISIIGGAGGGGAAIGMSTNGDTSGNTGTFTSGTYILAGSNSMTLHQSTGGGGVHTLWLRPAVSQLTVGANITLSSAGSTISIIGPSPGAGYTAYTFQNRQLGASTTINSLGGQSSLWLAPVRLPVDVSASTFLVMISYSGTITSAATAQHGETLRFGIWSQNATNSSRFDTWWTASIPVTFWNSGTSSYSYNFGGTTGSSAGSDLATLSVMGGRIVTVPIGSIIPAGLYLFGHIGISSSAGYSAAMSQAAIYMDNPLSLAMGYMGSATNTSVGYADGGRFSAQTANLPASIGLSQIQQVANVMPYYKVGASL